MIAIGTKGELYFTGFESTFTTKSMRTLRDRLTRRLGRKIHPILDGHPVHRSPLVKTSILSKIAVGSPRRVASPRLR